MTTAPTLRILLIGNHLKFGGGERHMVTLAKGLLEQGHNIALNYIAPPHDLLADLKDGGITQIHCCESKGGFSLRAIRQLASSFRKFAPDLVIVNSQFSLLLTCLARLLALRATPLILISHGMEIDQPSPAESARFRLYLLFYSWTARIVYVSSMQRTFYHKLGVRPLRDEVIHNGIDSEHYSIGCAQLQGRNIREQLAIKEDDFVIGMCAMFREEKGHLDLLEALRKLLDQNICAKVLLVGDGATRQAIEARCRALNLTDNVILVGGQRDVRPYISACEVMALTSRAETFPLATLEYMAMGKALVASDVGGLREQIRNGHNGLLYPAGDIVELTACLKLLANLQTRTSLAINARADIESKFSLHTMIERFNKTCISVVSGDAKLSNN
jgi:glycosyltransferase involved in cell wall biosynthesis